MKNLNNALGIILVITIFSSCEKKPSPPVISTTAATEISTTSAVSGGNITADGGAPIISKGVCWNTTTDPTVANSKTSESGESLSFTSNITRLLPNTTYYVRAYATNSAGTSYGKSVSFKTLGDKPVSNALNTSDIQLTTATLNGTVNPNSLETTVTFEYGKTTSYGSTLVAQQSPLSGDSEGNVTADLTELAPGTTYHFRIKAENTLGITYSSDITFTTLGSVPSATALAAANLQVNSATIKGSVNPNYLSSTVEFEWGTTTSYGNKITSTQSPVTGSAAVSVSADLTGLTPGTTYHFRIIATNELGTTNSGDLTFKTLGQVPSADTMTATNLQYSTATINGSVNPNYLATTVSFEWGTTAIYGNTITITQNPISGSTSQNVSADISGLSTGTDYHFRIKAINEMGTTFSDDLMFTTLAPITDVEGNVYNIQTIGNQIWMTENLKTTKYSNAATITYGLYYPANDESNVAKYGYLYDWAAAINQPAKYDTIMMDLTGQRVQGVCPTGWHLPTVQEWLELVNNFGGTEVAALKLKIANESYWLTPLLIEEPVSGFNAIPAGNRMIDGTYHVCGENASYWTSSQFWDGGGTIMGRQIYMRNFQSKIYIDIPNTNNQPGSIGLSVRCLKD
jgi:uncharacterized protein (TIGR02145 family)